MVRVLGFQEFLAPATFNFWEFPPTSCWRESAEFSSVLFLFLTLFITIWIYRLSRSLVIERPQGAHLPKKKKTITVAFFGLLLALAWTLAWSRFSWFEPLQRHTFFMVWFSFIALGNSFLYWRSGTAPITKAPLAYLLSFPISAFFWWMFEYINRYVRNWCYLSIEDFTPNQYIFFATISFSTVLPAVWVMQEFLSYFITFGEKHERSFIISRSKAIVCLLLSFLFLGSLPLQINKFLYPLVWLAPISLALALETVIRGPKRYTGAASFIAKWSVAGVACGILWEMWNYYSLAKWIYHVPFVQRFHLFEMPILGYGGYIPFGVLCGIVIGSIKSQRDAL